MSKVKPRIVRDAAATAIILTLRIWLFGPPILQSHGVSAKAVIIDHHGNVIQ